MTCSAQLYCVANDETTLARDLLRSPEILGGQIDLTIIKDALSASAAYNDAVNRAEAEILVFAHQDVYFPEGWFEQLKNVCEQLTGIDPCWATAGVFGALRNGGLIGHLWDSGLGHVCGAPVPIPQEVVSLDEVVLIVRRSSGASFDPELPSFHLYGTDVVLEALKLGKRSYVIDLPVIHNSKAVSRLDNNYVCAYSFMVHKWKSLLPWPTVILPLSRNPIPLLYRRLRLRYKAICRASTLHKPLERPDIKAKDLGFDFYDRNKARTPSNLY